MTVPMSVIAGTMTSCMGERMLLRKDQRNGIRAGADPNRAGRSHGAGELVLERLDLRAEHEPPAVEHAADGRVDICRVLARPQPRERHRHRNHPRPAGMSPALSR